MSIPKRIVAYLILFFFGQTFFSFSMEGRKFTSSKLPRQYEFLIEKDKEEVKKLYHLTKKDTGDELVFSTTTRCQNQEYMTPLLVCLTKENQHIKKIKISRALGTLTFVQLFPLLPNYKVLNTLDISNNNISDKLISDCTRSFSHLVNLETLFMESNKITEKSISLLLNIFNAKEMKLLHLGLGQNKISEKSALKEINLLTNIEISYLDLSNQKNNNERLTGEEYEKELADLKMKFPNFTLILRKLDIHILTETVLPLDRLIVVSLSDTSSTTSTTTHEEEPAFSLPNSPIRKTLPTCTWDPKNTYGFGSKCIMAVDPSGAGADPTGYAVVKVNPSGDYLITNAGGVKGDGLADATFATLLRVAEEEDVETIVIEHNYHQGAYLTAFKHYCQTQQLLKMWREGKKVQNYLEEMGLKFNLESHKTTEKDKGQRIINTLMPLLESEKLFIEDTFFYNDWENRHETPSLIQQLSIITPNFKSQTTKNGSHDDLPDALEIAIKFLQRERKKQELRAYFLPYTETI